MKLPDFIFIGPDKAGSTWIYEALKVHPHICIAKAKDIYFFDRYFYKGIDWYKKRFINCDDDKVVGELSHDYMFSKEAPFRIKQTLPDVKIITCLRNPFQRSYSNYLFLIKHGLTKDDFITACSKFPEIIKCSLYAPALERYLSIFDREKILILRFEILKRNPENFLESLYRFLCVDPSFRPQHILNKKVLPAAKPRYRMLSLIVKKIACFVRDLGYPELVGQVKHSDFVQNLLYKTYKDSERPTMSKEEKLYLRKIFLPDIEKLEMLLNENFNEWKKV